MTKDPNKCVVEWCESRDTKQTGIGPVCARHRGEKPEEKPKSDDPNTLSIAVNEKVASGDGLA